MCHLKTINCTGHVVLSWLRLTLVFYGWGFSWSCNTGFEISNWMHLSVGQVDCKNHLSECTIHLSEIYKVNATYVKYAVVRLSFLLVSDDRTSEISNPAIQHWALWLHVLGSNLKVLSNLLDIRVRYQFLFTVIFMLTSNFFFKLKLKTLFCNTSSFYFDSVLYTEVIITQSSTCIAW